MAVRVLIACALIIVIPCEARADGAGVIAVSKGERATVGAAMAQAMTGRAGRIVEDAVGEARAALSAGAVPIERVQKFRRVVDLVNEGWRAYTRVAVEVAAGRLAAARTEAEPLVALPGGPELYADAALRLGAVLGHLGRRAEAQAVLALAIALDPERPITLAEFSPDVVEAVDAARAAPVALQRVRIVTRPAGALIRIDSKDVGRSPLEVQLTRGQHLVIARAPMHHPAVQGVPIDAASVEIDLERDDEAARIAAGATQGLEEPAAQQLITATLRFADLDEVVLVADTVRRGGPTLLVQRCAGVPARCSAVVDVGYGDRSGLAAAARTAWDAARSGDLRYPPSVLGERDGQTDDGRCKACRNPWLWTGVGAAVVAATVITIAVVSGSQPPPIVGVDGGAFGAR
ncbi:MAG: hypothetical protein JWP01_49 [Myxococcales bacterium]|nr:hypothetical protein [Myxococcales bacterium]